MTSSPDPDSLIGRQLGSCLLEKPLGVGGMGAVYLAQQERPRRAVAVKVLRPQLAADREAWRVFLTRFRLEADATAALDHANIVPIYEFGEADDMAYLVMPYLADGSLAALLAREWMLPIPRALSYTEQAASALDYAHQHGIVHRDVKPSNLLLHPDGRLLLADFGIARLMDRTDAELSGEAYPEPLAPYEGESLTQTGSAMGTPEYMAPEQVRGEAAGAASDIYALGIVTYVMLAGRSPFAGGDIKTVLTRQLADPPLPLRTTRDDITPRMEEVIFWALAKDSADRPATASAFAQALAAAAGSRAKTLGAALRRSSTAVFAARPSPAGGGNGGSVPRAWGRPSTGTVPLPPARGAGTGAAALAAASGGAPPPAVTDSTLFDGAPPGPTSGATAAPMWPVQPRRDREISDSRRLFGTPLAALAAAVVALVLVATLVMGSLAQSGRLGPNNGTQGGTHALGSATPSPTITPHPTATSTPLPANWLAVSPGSVSLACKGKGLTKYVTLRNIGPDKVQWRAHVISDALLRPISVQPGDGTLDSSDSVTIQITATSYFSHSGSVQFIPSDSVAGQPAVVAFTIGGGGCL